MRKITTKFQTGPRSFKENIRKFTASLFFVLAVMTNSFAQTAPTAQSLPYSQDFNTLSFSSTTFPAGWQGWAVGGAASGAFRTNAPTLNALLTASSTAATTAGGVHNYNLKIGILPSGSVDPSLGLGIITTGKYNIVVNFDIMTIRNPYDGTTNTRINGCDLQYNVGGITGTWTTVSGIANGIYQNNTTTQIGTVTSPQNSQSKSFTLPAACNNQTAVYLRWVMRDISGAGSRPSFAVDNISICPTTATPTITISGPTSFCNGASVTYTSVNANGGTTPSYQWKKNGSNVGTNSSSVTLSGLIAGDQVTCDLTSNLGCISALTVTSNTITIGPLNSPPSLSASITNTSCVGAHTGAINLTVSGGTGPYTVCWDTVNISNGAMFGVTFASKTAAHPYFGTGSAFGYLIDGVQGKALTLTRGISYSFNVATTASHPFFVSSSVVGGTTSTLVASGQSGAPTGTGTVTFTPNNTHPSLLYYACQFHQYMGYNINIQNGYCVEDISSLAAGIYTVIVTDANGCTATAQYTVGANPGTLSANANITNAACSGSNTGAIDLTVTGGTGPYTVCWDTTNTFNGPTFGVMVNSMTPSNPFFGLGNGLTYYIDGAESKILSLMKGITYSFNILSPGHPWHISTDIIGGNANNIVTSGQSGAPNDNGTVLFTPNASHPSHLYYLCSNHAYMGSNVNIVDGYCTEDLTNLAPGVYSVLVTDANGCTFTTQFTVGTEPSTLSATGTPTNVTCEGAHNGSINLDITGGTGPYTVCWDTTNIANGPMFGVTVDVETPAHAYFGQGIGLDFYIDGVEAPVIDLVKGITYSFDIFSPGHPWHISTDFIGGSSGGLVSSGQSGAPTDIGTVTFTPNASHPSLLYYVCANHAYMGYNINIVNGYCVEDPANLGPGIYTAIITDANGCTTTTTVTIDTDPDVTNPTITCPSDIVQCDNDIANFTPTVSDNCDGVTYECTPESGSNFSVGTTSVTCTATDASGNTASCSFNVIINESPVIGLCPSNITQCDNHVATFSTPTATGTPTPTVICSPASGSTFATGTTTVTCTATNSCGSSSCSFTVTINESPVISACPSNITQCDNHIATWTNPTATGTPTPTVVCSPASGSTFATGTTSVTCTATNSCGSSSCSFNVTINETPVLTCPGNINDATSNPGGMTETYTAPSGGTPSATATCTPPSGSNFPIGTTTVNCSATNLCGTGTCSFTVTITLNCIPPSIGACPSDITQCDNHIVTWTDPTATGSPTPTVTCVPASGSTFVTGTTTITCTASNGCAPDASCSFNVTINESPVIGACPSNITQCDNHVATFSTPTATGTPTPTVICSPASGSTFAIGTTTVTCTATNSCGSSSCSFTVTINESPVIGACPSNISQCDNHIATWTDPTATGTPTPTVVCSPASGSTFATGTTSVTCTATNSCGSSSCSFNVTINETPVLTCPGNINDATSNPGGMTETYTAPSGGTPSATATCTPPSGSNFPIGTTTVNCSATNLCGTGTCSFTVTITLNCIPPSIGACPSDITQCDNHIVTWTDPTATGSPTPTVTCVPASGSTFVTGTTIVTCTASNGCAPDASCSFNVTINESPVIGTCPSNITQCDNHVATWTDPTATGTPTLTVVCSPVSGSTFATGTTTVTCTATNSCGSSSCSFTVTINETGTAPVSVTTDDTDNEICTSGIITLTANGGTFGTPAGSYKWYESGCGSGSVIGTGATLIRGPGLSLGTHVYYVRIENSCGNTSCASVTVTVTGAPPATNVPFPTVPAYACNGNNLTASTTPVANATTYTWDGPTGTAFNSSGNPYSSGNTTVTVNYGPPNGSGYNICVQASNSCGSTNRRCSFVRGTVNVPGAITPANNRTVECASTSASYSIAAVTGATSYTWSITGSATVIGSGTSATVNFGAGWAGGTLCVTANTPCYSSAPRCLALSNVTVVPGPMTGSSTACPGSSGTYSVPAVSGAATYNWVLPVNTTGSSSSNSILVNFLSGYTLGDIKVSITSICGVTTSQLSKTVASGIPTTPASISGNSTGLCGQTVVFSCPSVSGASSYTWTTCGTINSGQGSTSINATYGSFTNCNVCVTSNNACGSSAPRCIPLISKPVISGNITYTPGTICANQSGVDFQVSSTFGTSGYNWNFPSGVTTVLDLGNEQIVNWGSNSGVVSVTAANACGNATRSITITLGCRESSQGKPVSEDNLTIYPNPANDVLYIDFTSPEKQNIIIQISDVTGRTIISENKPATIGNNHSTLDIHHLAPGIYTINMKGIHLKQPVKIVVE